MILPRFKASRSLRIALVSSLLVASLGLFASESARLALVIGNAAYEGSALLKNPVNDATDVCAALKQAGWQVTLVTDADRRGMNGAIDAWGEQLASNPDSSALFYYAGHGMQVDGANYLLPVKTPFMTLADIKHDALNLNDVTLAIESAKVQVSLIVLDACRDNPFAKVASRSAGGEARGLNVVQSGGGAKGSAIIFSTSPGDIALDGVGRNGVFTAAFLKNIEADLKLEDMFKKVTAEVRQATDDKQRPWINASLTSEFYLLGEQLRQVRAAELAKAAAEAAQKIAAARQAELDALVAQVKSTEAAKAETLQKQLEAARRDADTARAAQAEAAAQAVSMAAEAAMPKGKVRFESSLEGRVFFGARPLGNVKPDAPLFVDALPTGAQEFRFEAAGIPAESKLATVTTAAYSTVFFGKPLETATVTASVGGVKVVLDPAQRGNLAIRARPLSDKGASLVPVVLASGRPNQLTGFIEVNDNFLEGSLAVVPGSNTLSSGTWLFSARQAEDKQEAWYQVYTVTRGTSEELYLPIVAYSGEFKLAGLQASKTALMAPLKKAQVSMGLRTVFGWVTLVPASIGATLAVLMSPQWGVSTLWNPVTIGSVVLGGISATLFLLPDPSKKIQKEIDLLDEQSRLLAPQGNSSAKQ